MIVGSNRTILGNNDTFCQSKANANAVCIGILSAVKSFKNVRKILFGKATSAIGDLYQKIERIVFRYNTDMST